jgi:hypothetical protein
MSLRRRVIDDERAQDLGEYGIALAVVGVVAVAVAISIGTQVGLLWSPVDSVIATVHDHGHHRGGGNSGNGGGNAPP